MIHPVAPVMVAVVLAASGMVGGHADTNTRPARHDGGPIAVTGPDRGPPGVPDLGSRPRPEPVRLGGAQPAMRVHRHPEAR